MQNAIPTSKLWLITTGLGSFPLTRQFLPLDLTGLWMVGGATREFLNCMSKSNSHFWSSPSIVIEC